MRASECASVGCQGWNYEDWITGPASVDKVFYPQGTRAAGMLDIYARAFGTVEVDSTFYAIPSTQTMEGWNRRTPSGFTFSLKLPQEITHVRGLRDGSAALVAEFCERARMLGDKLAAVLIQLPPQFIAVPENKQALREFLPRLPRDIRFSIEFRSADWLRQRGLAGFLRQYNVALALVEGEWLAREEVWRFASGQSADFAYVRWMGPRNLTRFDIVQRPQDQNLRDWTSIVTGLCERLPRVYAYFSNFYEGYAPASANKLKRLLGQPVVLARDLEDQPSLF
ncbi:MAG TPA: DUF72 domain-containing protein [Pyrinomonadaceae bacterium]|nr:DUF72 domain-containing protein [Pyrinomonadaceae bacterium]